MSALRLRIVVGPKVLCSLPSRIQPSVCQRSQTTVSSTLALLELWYCNRRTTAANVLQSQVLATLSKVRALLERPRRRQASYDASCYPTTQSSPAHSQRQSY